MPWSLPLHSLLWAQAGAAAATAPARPPAWLLWMFVWGEPAFTVDGTLGGLITWLKVVGLFCLIGWIGSWVVAAIKNPPPGRRQAFGLMDLGGVLGIALGLVAALLGVMVATKKIPENLRSGPPILGLTAAVLVVLWAESKLWSILRRQGSNQDRTVLVFMHLALGLGFVVAFVVRSFGGSTAGLLPTMVQGGRLAATYMGLVVLARIVGLLIPELLNLRWRRLFAIAWLSWVEAFRRMWAPWVVIAVFAVILAFTSWFLQPPRPAELGRLYVGTLMLLISILLTLTVVILAPISLPNDVRQQTIFTVVSKPVRRLEMIWGRLLGYMGLVTVLLLLFGGISLLYFERQVGAARREALAAAEKADKEDKPDFARKFREQYDQLSARMSARVPVTGSLIFFDSKNVQRRKGIDVGMELPTRSFVEGATPARALWRFGARIPNPINEQQILDKRVPVDRLLKEGTIEWVDNRIFELADQMAFAEQQRQAPNLKASETKDLSESVRRSEAELKTLQAQRDRLVKQEQALQARNTPEARREIQALHSPDVPIEMTFNVYRTTKGVLGEPVGASLVATNPRPGVAPHRDLFDVKEYYTNKRGLPARVLAGSRGELVIEIRCLSPNQYLGMAEGDLYLLSSEGRFWTNYLRGLTGVWLQAMILTAIGVFAGTFLSWPVALLTTLFFFIAGNAGFVTLQQLALSSELVGGGPFEALIRTLSHENLVTELDPTPAVVVAKTVDAILTPLMSRLVYLVPNFSALDVSETVANGFAVTWSGLSNLILLALAYTIPFSLAGYFILKQREVAA